MATNLATNIAKRFLELLRRSDRTDYLAIPHDTGSGAHLREVSFSGEVDLLALAEEAIKVLPPALKLS